MNKHTPGPWHGGREVINDSKGRALATVYYLGVSQSDRAEIPIAEGHANSFLMAAAPELLLACEGALIALKLGRHVDKQQAINYLEEALEKAKGEE